MASDTGGRAVLAATTALVAGVGALAFAVSFDAISAYAVTTGAFPTHLGWAAPLLVDSFTTAATLVIYTRSRAGQRALLAWTYVAASTLVSTALNVAHAPDTLPARLIAAIPPIAQLAAIELVMSEARRRNPQPFAQHDAATAPAGEALHEGPADRNEPAASPVAGVGSARDQIRELLAQAEAEGNPDEVTGPAAAAATGVSVRRAQQLLADLRKQPTAMTRDKA